MRKSYARPAGLVYGSDARQVITEGRGASLGGLGFVAYTLVEVIERDGHCVLQHQVEPEIAHGARLHIEGGSEHDGQRQEGQGLPQEAPVHAACSAKEASNTFSSVSSSAPSAATMAPLRNT